MPAPRPAELVDELEDAEEAEPPEADEVVPDDPDVLALDPEELTEEPEVLDPDVVLEVPEVLVVEVAEVVDEGDEDVLALVVELLAATPPEPPDEQPARATRTKSAFKCAVNRR